MERYDLAIIGSGPAGYVAAGKAGAAGMKTVMFEKSELGGVCLNEGCIPTKTLLYGAKVFDTVRHGDRYGVKSSEAAFDYARMAARKNKVVRKLVLGIAASMKQSGVEVVKGEAVIAGRAGDGFAVECGGERYEASRLLICTGSQTFVPPIEGIASAGDRVITSREMLQLKELPQSLVIVGGGVIGMEFASLCCSLMCRVTVIEMMPEILGGMDGEIAAMLREEYARRGVQFFTGCRVTRIDGAKVMFDDADGEEHSVEGEKILMSVGRRAVVSGLGLESVGVAAGRGIAVDEHMKTAVAGVYAAGDVTGISMLAHTASREAEVAVNDMLGVADTMSYKAIPGVVYTSPEVAGVGVTEEAVQGMGYTTVKLPMSYAGRFVAENEGVSGLCKVVVDAQKRVAGVHLLGNPAGEMIGAACMAVERGMTVDEFARTVFPHPTVSEIMKLTAERL